MMLLNSVYCHHVGCLRIISGDIVHSRNTNERYDESTQKTPAQTIRRFIRAKEYGKKFLGYSERKDQGRGSG